MLERWGSAGSRAPKVIFVGAALMGCFAASACSGSESTTSEETPTAQATTAEEAMLPAYARDLQPQIEEKMTDLRIPGALVYVVTLLREVREKAKAVEKSRPSAEKSFALVTTVLRRPHFTGAVFDVLPHHLRAGVAREQSSPACASTVSRELEHS